MWGGGWGDPDIELSLGWGWLPEHPRASYPRGPAACHPWWAPGEGTSQRTGMCPGGRLGGGHGRFLGSGDLQRDRRVSPCLCCMAPRGWGCQGRDDPPPDTRPEANPGATRTLGPPGLPPIIFIACGDRAGRCAGHRAGAARGAR